MDVRSSKVIKLIKDGEVFLKVEEHPFSLQGTDIELNNYYTYSRAELKKIIAALQQRVDDLEAEDQAIRDKSEAMMKAACANLMWGEVVMSPAPKKPVESFKAFTDRVNSLDITITIPEKDDDDGLDSFEDEEPDGVLV